MGQNLASETDVWAIFRALRDTRTVFGLRPGHIQTLQALLSFLKPGQGDTVFASNVSICERAGGIDERTVRRHIKRLVELGFVLRNDSPNNKRYRARSSTGLAISFGLSLEPLINRANELISLAHDLEQQRREAVFLRKQIQSQLAKLEDIMGETADIQETRKILRRKLKLEEYQQIHTDLTTQLNALHTHVTTPKATSLPANDGQTVRHQSSSKKRKKDLERSHRSREITPRYLLATCKQATSFASGPLETWNDIERHAETLAPMLGIQPAVFNKAREKAGDKKTVCAIFAMLEIGHRIRNFSAYFHSITLGQRQHQFDALKLLDRLSGAST